MQGLQNIAILPFALAAILLLHRNRFALACTALLFSVATSGNGFFVAFVGGLLLLQQRNRRRLAIWVALTVALAALYAVHYTVVHVGVPAPFFQSKLNLLLFPFIFLGSLGDRVPLCAIVGLIFAVLVVLLTRRGWRLGNPPAFYAVIFILITALAVDGTRHNLGLDTALSSRYRLYSLIFLILLYYGALDQLLPWPGLFRLRTWTAFTVVCAIFCLRSDRVANRVLHERDQLLIQHVEQWLGDPAIAVMPDEAPFLQTPGWRVIRQRAAETLRTSMRAGIYTPPYPPQMHLAPAPAAVPAPDP